MTATQDDIDAVYGLRGLARGMIEGMIEDGREPEDSENMVIVRAVMARATEGIAALVQESQREDTPETIARWIEAGLPPWGCHHCRGAEYGPDGVPCTSCHGKSDDVPDPPVVARIRAALAPDAGLLKLKQDLSDLDWGSRLSPEPKGAMTKHDSLCIIYSSIVNHPCNCGFEEQQNQ